MGITFDVESIITHPLWRTPGPHQRYIIQQGHVTYICNIFGWDTTPWAEPSEIKGTGGSANRSRWFCVLSLALYLEFYAKNINTLSTSDLIELAVNVEHTHLHNTSWPPIRRRQFRHLLNHHENRAFWLPHDVEKPQFVETVILNSPGQYDFSFGSSLRLKQEMELLCQVCDRIVAVRNPLINVGIHSWSGVQDLCYRIRDAAHESLTLNLPLQIFW